MPRIQALTRSFTDGTAREDLGAGLCSVSRAAGMFLGLPVAGSLSATRLVRTAGARTILRLRGKEDVGSTFIGR